MPSGKADWDTGRLLYYDRNPSPTVLSYIFRAVAPAGSTLRATYTVPTDKKAFLETSQLDVVRSAAATTPSFVAFLLRQTPSGGTAQEIQWAQIQDNHNAVGDRNTVFWASSIMLLEGDVLAMTTLDSSTGGAIDYLGIAKVNEFDE